MASVETGPIYIGGRVVGTVTFGVEDEVDNQSQRLAYASTNDLPIGIQSGAGDSGDTHYSSGHAAARVKHGPTFRPGVTSRGSAPAARPEHLTTQDVAKAVHGTHDAPEHFTTGDVKAAVEGRSKSGKTLGWWTSDRQQHAMSYLMDHGGLPEISARAMVARWAGVEAQSGPSEVNSIGASGIGQWLGGRKVGMGSTFDEQLSHAVNEMKGTSPNRDEGAERAFGMLKGATNEVEAATGASQFERAEGYDPRTGADAYVGKTIRTMREMSASPPTGVENLAGPKPLGVTRLDAAPNSPPTTVANQSDLDYLASRGGHSTMEGKSAAPGATMGFDPELAARLSAAGRTYEKETGGQAKFGEMDRDAATQAGYYDAYIHGRGGIAARPGHSEHQKGKATDLPTSDFRSWLKAGNMGRFGLHFPVRGDAPHVQADPSFKGSLITPSKTADDQSK